jgi:PAS domain-containing protein
VQGEAVEPGADDGAAAPEPASERSALLRLRDILDELPAAVALLTGPDHVFEFVNADYARLVGGTELLGRRVVEALPEVAAQGFVQLLDDVYPHG